MEKYEREYRQAQSDEQREHWLLLWCVESMAGQAFEELKRALVELEHLATALQSRRLHAWKQFYDALLHLINKDLDTSFAMLHEARDTFVEFDDYVGEARSIGNIGRVYMMRDMLDEALELALTASDIALHHNDVDTFTRVLGLVQNCFWRRGEYDVFYNYLKKWVDHFKGTEFHDLYVALGNNAALIVLVNLSRMNESIEIIDDIIEVARAAHNYRGLALALDTKGSAYWYLGDAGRSIEYYMEAIHYAELTKDAVFYSIRLMNAAYPYMLLDDYQKVLDLNTKAKDLVVSVGRESESGWAVMGIGTAKMHLGEVDEAVRILANAIQLITDEFDMHGLGYAYFRMGEAQLLLHQTDAAYEAFNQSLEARRHSNAALELAETQCERAQILVGLHRYDEASDAIEEALQMATSINAKAILQKIHKVMSSLCAARGRYAEAYEQLQTHIRLNAEVQSQESTRKVASLEYMHQHELQRKEQESILNILYKTLPRSVADRVIKGEARIAEHFENVSVLFADIVGFTSMASTMPPDTLLDFMNFVFECFDSIAAKCGCERIKTIGDGYMAVCGAPERDENHVLNIARMASTMMETIVLPDDIGKNLPDGTEFELRIGLHCGELTAGMIGTGKLAYDVYGDTVNIAARMEQYGAPGKIHVSQYFKDRLTECLQRSPQLENYSFVSRAELNIKGKGVMQTFFMSAAEELASPYK